MNDQFSNLGLALRAIDDVWNEAKDGLFVARERGEKIDRLPDLSEAEALRKGALGREILERIDSIDAAALPGDLPTTLAVARERASMWVKGAQWYWTVFDPAGVGFFALFAPAAYAGGYLLNFIADIFRQYEFASAGDDDRYLGLVSDYARTIHQMRERTAGQAQRGMYAPKAQLAQSIALLRGLRGTAGSILQPANCKSLAAEIERRVSTHVLPAFDAFLADLENPEYALRAPERVGIKHYPGGREIYAELVRLHTTLELTPEEVHAKGLQRMENVRAEMAQLFERIGFAGTPKEYLARIETDPAWHAADADALSAFFRRYIDRIAPHLERYFGRTPKAEHDVAPLPQALSGSMTFGYYSPPNRKQEKGLYIFNAANMTKNALPNVAALNYHELVPGHHMHLGTQGENRSMHPLRQYSLFTAFTEGWAEYAASLAGEMGMYAAPEEQFGRLMMEAFLTSRLVVDTGMNALDWSLERARGYLREYSFMPQTEIASETLRYSCDIPGQSLAYKLGDDFISDLREDFQTQLGERFDIRAFHDAVLEPGALPLPLMASEVRRRLYTSTSSVRPSTSSG